MRTNFYVLATVFFFICVANSCAPKKDVAAKINKITTPTLPLESPILEEVILPLAPPPSDTLLVSAEIAELPVHPLAAEEKTAALYKNGRRKDLDAAEAMHYDLRKPNYVVIHHTAQQSLNQTVRTFSLAHTKVSAHYVVGRDGQVVQLLNDYLRGWHAGKAKWGSVTDLNSVSLGVELDNNGKEPFPDVQIQALMNLLDTLKKNYEIPQANFIGHADIAPTRKDDPSVFFPWKTLADRGFGIWYNESYLVTPPANFNPSDALRIIGYDVTNLNATIVAFKRKYIQIDLTPTLTNYDLSVLYDLYKKY